MERIEREEGWELEFDFSKKTLGLSHLGYSNLLEASARKNGKSIKKPSPIDYLG